LVLELELKRLKELASSYQQQIQDREETIFNLNLTISK